MRIPFLRPKTPSATPERARPAPMGDDPTEVQAARTQARRRLVGAVVLLLIGVVGFPVLFETQPRPLPIDTPIEVPRRDTGASGLTGKDAGPPKAQPLPVLPADVGTEEAPTPTASASAASSPASALASAPVPLPLPVPVPVPVPVPGPTPAQSKVAPVVLAAAPVAPPPPAPKPVAAPAAAPAVPLEKPVAASSPAAESGRFVIQAGAYSEAGKLREARAKIEKLGLKTYTQVVDTDKGSRTRVRVGPYATRAEAEAVAAKVKRSGLPAAVLAL
jgi:DedD protein